MSKRIRCIGYKQTFKVIDYKRFKKIEEDGWLIRGLHYFYIDETEDIEKSYLSRFNTDSRITYGWGNWHQHSDNVSIMDSEHLFQNINSEVVEIKEFTFPTMEKLYRDMDAKQFKEWFKSNY